MPRPLELTVQSWPPLKHRPYAMEVLTLRKKGQAIHVTLVHLDDEQAGRRQEICLSLPLLPSPHPSTLFFDALGFPVHVSARINPKEAIGRRMLVTFDTATADVEPKPVKFQPLKETEDAGTTADSPSEPTADQAETTGFDGS